MIWTRTPRIRARKSNLRSDSLARDSLHRVKLLHTTVSAFFASCIVANHCRQDNFDIYLPLWLARYNKLIFGAIYLAGIAYTLVLWRGA